MWILTRYGITHVDARGASQMYCWFLNLESNSLQIVRTRWRNRRDEGGYVVPRTVLFHENSAGHVHVRGGRPIHSQFVEVYFQSDHKESCRGECRSRLYSSVVAENIFGEIWMRSRLTFMSIRIEETIRSCLDKLCTRYHECTQRNSRQFSSDINTTSIPIFWFRWYTQTSHSTHNLICTHPYNVQFSDLVQLEMGGDVTREKVLDGVNWMCSQADDMFRSMFSRINSCP